MHELEAKIRYAGSDQSETKVRLEPGRSASDVSIHLDGPLRWLELSRGVFNEARDQAPAPVVEGGFSVEWPAESCDPGWVTITRLEDGTSIELRADEMAGYMQDTFEAALGSYAIKIETLGMRPHDLRGES